MKYLILLGCLVMSNQAQSADPVKDVDGLVTLSNHPQDFFLLSNVNKPAQAVFLSYTGLQFNHCGIAIRTSGVNVAALFGLITITSKSDPAGQNKAVIEKGLIVAKVSVQDKETYGEFFEIRTRSGKTLRKEISKFLSAETVSSKNVIVEILPCE